MSQSQLLYAALDAHCLLAIMESQLVGNKICKVEDVSVLSLYLTEQEIAKLITFQSSTSFMSSGSVASGYDFLTSRLHSQEMKSSSLPPLSEEKYEEWVEGEFSTQMLLARLNGLEKSGCVWLWDHHEDASQREVYLSFDDEGSIRYLSDTSENEGALNLMFYRGDACPSPLLCCTRTKTIIVAVLTNDASSVERFVAVVLDDRRAIDFRKLAIALAAKRRRLRLATAQECVIAAGYSPGHIPALGLYRGVETLLLDTSLSTHRQLILSASTTELHAKLITIGFSCSLQDLTCIAGKALLADCSKVEKVESVAAAPIHALEQVNPENYRMIAPSRDAAGLRFLCDAMLVKLGRWLRVLGCDVVIYEEGGDRAALIDTAERESRILLTKDRRRASHASSHTKLSMIQSAIEDDPHILERCLVMLVSGRSTEAQLKEVTEFLNIHYREDDFMSRCSSCNEKGFREADIDEVRRSGTASEHVISVESQFFACLSCGKYFWEGPKFKSAKSLIGKFVSR